MRGVRHLGRQSVERRGVQAELIRPYQGAARGLTRALGEGLVGREAGESKQG